MKRDALGTRLPRRPAAVIAAALVATGVGLIGVPVGLQAVGGHVAWAPHERPTFHESVFVHGHAAAAPDSALLRTADVQRALPAPLRGAFEATDQA
jgi:hypothetical protein